MERADVEKLARLARIDISAEEADRLLGDFDTILGYVSQIQQATTDEPAEMPVDQHHNVMRDDVDPHESGLYTEAILNEAPLREGEYLKVKKIL